MGILPQILLLGDTIIEKTAFTLKARLPIQTHTGALRIDGHVRGYISGMVDADFSGTLHGSLNAAVEAGAVQPEAPPPPTALTADLDLSGVDFVPIPTFGGTFLGQGHTISGLCLTSAGSTQGLFRYVQPGALVRDLTVRGTVAPGGTRFTVGGIVGSNAGTLQK